MTRHGSRTRVPYGRIATWLKWRSKTDRLIKWARAVTCGSPHIAEYANGIVIPTVVDTKRFKPASPRTREPVIGWIGTHGTFPYLERLLPIFERLAREVRFRLLIVGSGRDIPGVETRAWSLEREVEDFQSLDIGVYPLADDEWSAGKAGFKAVQYMATGVPFVMSPVGVCATMGIAGETHLSAITDDEWLDALRHLVTDPDLRKRLSIAARRFAESHYDVEPHADTLAKAIRST